MAYSSSASPVVASPEVLALLEDLHAQSAAQESSYKQKLWYLSRSFRYYVTGTVWSTSDDSHVLDQFVALEPEKCHFVYLLARSIGALNIVEAGTSFGVSTIYLALAVGQNAALKRVAVGAAKVIATEKECVKAERAREHWKKAGREIEPWIELREGDLLETLKNEEDMPELDMLLLDIWTPLALPTLKLVKPRLRPGAVIVADNVETFKGLYKEFLEYIGDPVNGFRRMVVPFSGGLMLAMRTEDHEE